MSNNLYANHFNDGVPTSRIGHLVSLNCTSNDADSDIDDIWSVIDYKRNDRSIVRVKCFRNNAYSTSSKYEIGYECYLNSSALYYRANDTAARNKRIIDSKEQLDMFNTGVYHD